MHSHLHVGISRLFVTLTKVLYDVNEKINRQRSSVTGYPWALNLCTKTIEANT